MNTPLLFSRAGLSLSLMRRVRIVGRGAFLLGLMGTMVACPQPGDQAAPKPVADPVSPTKPGPASGDEAALPPDPDAVPEGRLADLPPDRRAIQFVHGKERIVDIEVAKAMGLTIVDLTDQWAPMLFDDSVNAQGKALVNHYRSVFVGLANDLTDADGRELEPGTKNYLELFGIPPSLSVLRKRFLDDEGKDCSHVDLEVLSGVRYIPNLGRRSEKQEATNHARRVTRLDAAVKKYEVADYETLADQQGRYAKDVKAVRRHEAEMASFAEVEKRILCEARMKADDHEAGTYDSVMRLAVLGFQRENMLLDVGDIGSRTLTAMNASIMGNNWASLRRTIAERAAAAGGFIEDGSVDGKKTATYRSKSGETKEVPNLVDDATQRTMRRLGVDSEEGALAFFKRHPEKDFQWLKVAVRFPALPEYYETHMDLSAELDRGDIWYDFPYDDNGQRIPQPRRAYPSLTLFVNYQGQRIALVKWRSTVGGWRNEMAADGRDYLRYKGSDIGPRVWRHIVASPVWIPPDSTPLGGMAVREYVNGKRQWVTNYSEVGPGYSSAYGLAMAVHVEERRHRDGRVTHFDNGIRTHGSFDYRSLLGRFSHGCHRLYNNLAVRLFSFVLSHRNHRVVGPVHLGLRRQFLREAGVFEMRLPIRGFYYELTPTLPIEVLEGNIKGKKEKPFEGYVMKPGVNYPNKKVPPPPGSEQSKAGGAATSQGDDS